ncbi:hypothetical protein Taro_051770, partial [Colocasia esculenta]|nr:hypothetical protein [Colocasia esculenta]
APKHQSTRGSCSQASRRTRRRSTPTFSRTAENTEGTGVATGLTRLGRASRHQLHRDGSPHRDKAIGLYTLSVFLCEKKASGVAGGFCPTKGLFLPLPFGEGKNLVGFKTNGSTLDRGDLFLKTRVKKNGLPVNEDIATVIEKFQNVKLTQLSSSKSSFASVNDTYKQVFGKDRPGRVRGVGTGPTPKSMWGSKEEALREQNIMLHNTLTDMQDRLKKLECIANEISMLGRKVKLCDMYRRPIVGGIVMAEEMSKMVMGK